ncbi:MAG TPA: prenyltransferase/squalene oxidase repeat-containing protein [Acidimicrobiia bacterium]|nr:prenyltransferase/squalene oxidase repeat-containing protein [Acidimicrobiia bacterium]
MRRLRRPRAVIGALCAVLLLGAFRFTGFHDVRAKQAASRGAQWISGQQLADGSFETAGFPGFETPDAVLAIAESAQTTPKWNKQRALHVIEDTTTNGVGVLHALDDFADSGIDAGQAAKLVVLDAKPLGISTTNFNPDHDKKKADLQAIIKAGAQANGSYGAFNATLYAAIALRLTHGSVPAKTLAFIRDAQQANGGWNFAGDPTGTDDDIDTTGLAIQALAAAKVSKNDATLRDALTFLADRQQSTGAWQSFGSDDPNSTSVAVVAITAAGYNPYVACWRNASDPDLSGHPYTSPIVWLRGQQEANGHIRSPNDGFGVNTFSTSQTVEALRREWTPVTPLGRQPCG